MKKRILQLFTSVLFVLALVACSSSSNQRNSSAPEGKILIVYFTPANSDTSDVKTSATPRVDNESSIAYFANQIHETVDDADIAKITPTEAYPTDYDATADQAQQENEDDARPTFILDVDPEDYDVIFIGYPIWWNEMPMIMDTFFDTYDFSGKTIIPFNTHAGSGDGGTYDDIANLEPDATILNGLAIAGDDIGDSNDQIKEWLEDLGY